MYISQKRKQKEEVIENLLRSHMRLSESSLTGSSIGEFIRLSKYLLGLINKSDDIRICIRSEGDEER